MYPGQPTPVMLPPLHYQGMDAAQQTQEFDSKNLICVFKEGLELEEIEKKQRGDEASQFNDLCSTVKEALGDKVEKVNVSNCITDSPCVLVTGQFSWSSNMEHIMKVQALCDLSMSSYMALGKTPTPSSRSPSAKSPRTRLTSPFVTNLPSLQDCSP